MCRFQLPAQLTETNQLESAEFTTLCSASALWKSSETATGVPRYCFAPGFQALWGTDGHRKAPFGIKNGRFSTTNARSALAKAWNSASSGSSRSGLLCGRAVAASAR